MGNCCEPASSMEWDGEDWSDLTSKNTSSSKVFDQTRCHGLSLGKVQKEKLMGVLGASPDAKGKVKIMISKKELAQLLEKQQQVSKKQVGRASAEQVLLRLIKARDHDSRHELWRPAASSMEWDGEDWSDLTSKKTCSRKVIDLTRGHELILGKVQKEKLMGVLRASPDADGKVKILISKKELAELLEKQQQMNNNKHVRRASAEQVLLRLTKARDHESRQGFWMPKLESIPEAS
ncbi:unnamed protein product [Sphenostylis stenocarpa]|uniref:Uncharacterized protein n=1 Tax=Sphenostylis stenocarpa TaxID=92480 RepID=A0AA86VD46_9FABA|nr:unnamed protein product [Sphenostylis stenocarpa]